MIRGLEVHKVACASVLLLATGCSITQRPKLTQIAQPAPALPVSEATLGAKISLQGLARHLETIVPSSYQDQGNETEWLVVNVCWPATCNVRTKICDWTWY